MHYFDTETTNYYWKQSSTLDWCEQNYITSSIIAEFWNTLTNLGYISLALAGIVNVHKYHFEPRFYAAYLSILVIGLGSWGFHATLLWEMQLADELPMIYATCVFLYLLFESSPGNRYGPALPLFLVVDAVFITGVYVVTQNPHFHQFMYGLNTVIITLRGMYVFHYELQDVQLQREKQMAYLVRMGCGLFGIGFIAWNIDNVFCEQLRWAREETFLGSVFTPLLQFHGWWHIGTGLGSYYFTVFCQLLRVQLLGVQNEYELCWWGVVPWVRTTKMGKLV